MPHTENQLCHTVTTVVAAPASAAFAFLADIAQVGHWALGSFDAKPLDRPDIYSGTSLYDGSACVFSVDADQRRLVVDYLVGRDARHLTLCLSARVIPGGILGRGSDACLVSIASWRPLGLDQRHWSRLTAFQEAEIHIVRDRIETAWAKRPISV